MFRKGDQLRYVLTFSSSGRSRLGGGSETSFGIGGHMITFTVIMVNR